MHGHIPHPISAETQPEQASQILNKNIAFDIRIAKYSHSDKTFCCRSQSRTEISHTVTAGTVIFYHDTSVDSRHLGKLRHDNGFSISFRLCRLAFKRALFHIALQFRIDIGSGCDGFIACFMGKYISEKIEIFKPVAGQASPRNRLKQQKDNDREYSYRHCMACRRLRRFL